MFGDAYLINRFAKVTGDMEAVEADFAGCLRDAFEEGVDEGFPHVHRDRLYRLLLLVAQGIQPCEDRLLLPIFQHLYDDSVITIRDDRVVLVMLMIRRLVDPQVRNHGGLPTRQAAFDCALLDPIYLIPTQAHQFGHGLDRFLTKLRDDHRLEQRREPTARLGPWHGNLLHPMFRAAHPWHIGL